MPKIAVPKPLDSDQYSLEETEQRLREIMRGVLADPQCR
jgi:hypothetical protein